MADNYPYFEDVEPGDDIGPVMQEPTREQIRGFFGGDDNRNRPGRFISDDDAKAEGLQNMIVPGPLSMAFLAQLLTDWAGPKGRLLKLEVNFRRVVNPGDKIACSGLVIDKDEVAGAGHVRIDVAIDNERGEKPLVGTAVVVLPKRG